MNRTRLKYYLRALGIGIIVTALLMGYSQKPPQMSDEEILRRAAELELEGQREVLADLATATPEPENSLESDAAISAESTASPVPGLQWNLLPVPHPSLWWILAPVLPPSLRRNLAPVLPPSLRRNLLSALRPSLQRSLLPALRPSLQRNLLLALRLSLQRSLQSVLLRRETWQFW